MAFPGEKQNNMFFTIWYGVYNKNSRELVYSSGGHPPALLLSASQAEKSEVQQLMTPNIAIGAMQDYQFQQNRYELTGPSRLYIFSDGVFEITKKDGLIWNFEAFSNFLLSRSDKTVSCLDQLIEHAKELKAMPEFEDDYTIIEITFT